MQRHICRLYNPTADSFFISRDVKFDETNFPFKQAEETSKITVQKFMKI